MEWVKATLKALGLVLLFAVVFRMFTGTADKKAATAAPITTNVTVPSGDFNDDVDEIESNLSVSDRYVKVYTDMPDANYRLGNPNGGPLLIPYSPCPSQPVIVVSYNDMRAYKNSHPIDKDKTYMLEYNNLHCQPDQRAYVLVGIHPVPGQWSDALLSQGVMTQEH